MATALTYASGGSLGRSSSELRFSFLSWNRRKKTSSGSGGGGMAVAQQLQSHTPSSDLLKPPPPSHRVASPSKSASQQGGDVISGNGRVSPMLKAEHGANGSFTQDQPLGEYLAASFATTEGSVASDYGMDESDSVDGLFTFSKSSLSPSDPQKIKQLTAELRSKIKETMENIKLAQEKKEENVYKYLSDAAREDPHGSAIKSKAAFEKQNQKSGQKIAHLQHKLEKYRKRLELLEAGIVPDKQHHALDMLRDVGQGLKDVGANIRDGLSGISGVAVDPHHQKRGAATHESQKLLRPMDGRKGFGSADNIAGAQAEGDSTHKDGKLQPHTLPAGFKYHSDEDIPAALQHEHGQTASGRVTGEGVDIAPRVDANLIMTHLENNRKLQESLLDGMEIYRIQTNEQLDMLRRELDVHKQRVEELECHIMEFSDSRRSDSDSFRQDLARLEERGDYRLEERVRDMQDMLDNCRNRISKMETQSSSLDLMEATNYSVIVTKLINVALALLAVVFVLVSASASLVRPLYATSGRLAVTCCMLICIFALWHLWPSLVAPHLQQQTEERLPVPDEL